MTPDPKRLTTLRKLARAVERADGRIDEARTERDSAILQAVHDQIATQTAIGEAAGVSESYVRKVVNAESR